MSTMIKIRIRNAEHEINIRFPISESELFAVAAEAALKGAENSKNFVSKFGRAKSYGQKTIGTPDAGAVSMSKFFEGLAKA